MSRGAACLSIISGPRIFPWVTQPRMPHQKKHQHLKKYQHQYLAFNIRHSIFHLQYFIFDIENRQTYVEAAGVCRHWLMPLVSASNTVIPLYGETITRKSSISHCFSLPTLYFYRKTFQHFYLEHLIFPGIWHAVKIFKEIQEVNFWFDIVEPTDVHLGEAFDR